MKGASLAVGGSLALGIALRTWQWAAGTSMWLDELGIALNVRDRDMGRLLFSPLDHQQMAPTGFLASVEASSAALGINEHALRLVPFVLGILALVLLWRVASRFLSGMSLAAVVLLGAASPALVWYAGNVKPYSGDVALTLLLVLLALRHIERPEDVRRAWWASGLGCLSLVTSYPAVLVGAVLGVILLVDWLEKRRPSTVRPLAILGIGWTLGAAAATWASLRFTNPDVRAYMKDFWAAGFAPWREGPLAVLLWIPERAFHVLAHSMVFLDAEAGILAAPVAALAVAGVIVAWRRQRAETLLLLAPLLAAWIGGLTHTLPMRNRLGVYAGLPVVILGMIALQALLEHRTRWVRGLGIITALIAVLPVPAVVLFAARPPYRAQETRPVLTALADRLRPGDTLYVYCLANSAVDFYGAEAGIDSYIVGGCDGSEEDFVDELRSLPDGRVWFFFTQWTPEQPWPDAAQDFLEGRGTEVERISDPYGLTGQADAAAVLYELGA